jgi:hypothetical protein
MGAVEEAIEKLKSDLSDGCKEEIVLSRRHAAAVMVQLIDDDEEFGLLEDSAQEELIVSALAADAAKDRRQELSSSYDLAFVEGVLQADAAPAEASFDNVIDMLNWLEEE